MLSPRLLLCVWLLELPRGEGCSREIIVECGGDAVYRKDAAPPYGRVEVLSEGSGELLLEAAYGKDQKRKCSDNGKICAEVLAENRLTVSVRNASLQDQQQYLLALPATGSLDHFCVIVQGICEPALSRNNNTMTCTVQAMLKNKAQELTITWLDPHRHIHPPDSETLAGRTEEVVTLRSSLTLSDDVTANAYICCSASYKGDGQSKESCETIPQGAVGVKKEEPESSAATKAGVLIAVIAAASVVALFVYLRKRNTYQRTNRGDVEEAGPGSVAEMDPLSRPNQDRDTSQTDPPESP